MAFETQSRSTENSLPESRILKDNLLPLDSAERLAVLENLEILDAPTERIFQMLTELANKLLGTPVSLISLVTDQRQFFVSSDGLGEPWASRRETGLSHSFCQHVVTRNEPLVLSDATEHELVCDNLATRDLDVRAYLGCPLVYPDGTVLGSFCVIDDKVRRWTTEDLASVKHFAAITASELVTRKEAIRKRDQLERQLQQAQKMEAVGNFTSGIAHDFNNVLASIQIHAELLNMEFGAQAPAMVYVDKITKTVASAKGIIQQLLECSRPDHNKMQTQELAKIVEDSLPLLAAFLPSTISVDQRLSNDGGLVLADASQIQQILMNLCSNAEHAMRDCGGKLCISVNTVELSEDEASGLNLQSGAYVRLMISDDGKGVPPEILHRVHDPFFTTKPVGEGTGLGLWTVFGIAKAHEARIKVDSKLQEGTTFEIFFPRAEAPEISIQGLVSSTQDTKPFSLARILLVDDQSDIRSGVHKKLASKGYTVTSCENGLDALKLFEDDPDGFDIIVSDQTMSQMTGDQLIQKIKTIRQTIPAIICSGSIPSEVERTGVDAFLDKPFSVAELSSKIEDLLQTT